MSLRKFVLVLALTGASAMIASTQLFAGESNRAFWGVQGTFDINIPGDYKTPVGNFNYQTGCGLSVGGFYNMPLVANLYFEPGVHFYYDTYKMDELTYGSEDGIPVDVENPKIEKTGFRFPLHIGYRFDIWENCSLNLYTGPEIGIGTSAKVKSKYLNDSGIDTNLYSDGYALDSNGSWHRFSAAWNIGASLTFSQRYTFGLTGSIGMTDLVESDKVSFKENALRISFAYNF